MSLMKQYAARRSHKKDQAQENQLQKQLHAFCESRMAGQEWKFIRLCLINSQGQRSSFTAASIHLIEDNHVKFPGP